MALCKSGSALRGHRSRYRLASQMNSGRAARVRDRPRESTLKAHTNWLRFLLQCSLMPISDGSKRTFSFEEGNYLTMAFRFVVSTVALSVVNVHAAFGGPLSESASREVAKLVAASTRQTHANKRMVWTGVAVAGTGVALASISTDNHLPKPGRDVGSPRVGHPLRDCVPWPTVQAVTVDRRCGRLITKIVFRYS
jgi:hypothetical protein